MAILWLFWGLGHIWSEGLGVFFIMYGFLLLYHMYRLYECSQRWILCSSEGLGLVWG